MYVCHIYKYQVFQNLTSSHLSRSLNCLNSANWPIPWPPVRTVNQKGKWEKLPNIFQRTGVTLSELTVQPQP